MGRTIEPVRCRVPTRLAAPMGLALLALTLAVCSCGGGRLDTSGASDCGELAELTSGLLEDMIGQNRDLTEADFAAGEFDDRFSDFEVDLASVETRRDELACGDDFLVTECAALGALDDGGVVATLILASCAGTAG